MHLLYSAALTLVLVLGLPFWLLQMARSGKYRAGLSERLGRVPARLRPTRANENCIWVHAVSVGEVLAVTRLIAELEKKFPEWRIVVSTTTKTGQALARTRFGEAEVFYLPLDLKIFLRPFFAQLRPRMLVLAESEFWMNLLAVAQENQCRVAVVNTRVSDRSLPRYLRIRGLLTKHIFSRVDLVLAQSELDAERARQIGAPASRVQVTGNLKFDLTPPAESEIVRKLREAVQQSAVLVCGSTVEGEEEMLAQELRERKMSDLVVVLAPRHPERFNAVADLLSNVGVKVVRRTTWGGEPLESGTVFLLDSIGELAAIYALADVAFVGGSLVPRGGHNVLEPAYFGKPILVGPHTENFRDIMRRFEQANAIARTESGDVLVGAFLLLTQPALAEMGKRAKQVMDENAGATQRTVTALEVLLWMPATLRAQMADFARSKQ
jgi:3-deoxy-D-manno-octulosonic-acid transferase